MAEKFNPIVIKTTDKCKDSKLHNKEFTLEYSRKAVQRAEKQGFRMDELDGMPAVRIPELFYHAFYMHHPFITDKQAEDIFDNELHGLTGEEVERLALLFASGYNSLVFDEEEDAEVKNARATVIL